MRIPLIILSIMLFGSMIISGCFLTFPPIDVCIDNDGDGYGDPASNSCDFGALDCNDNDVNYHPGATEVCGDPDYNCDGATLACPTSAGVIRSFSTSTVNGGGSLSVTLAVTVPSSVTYYFIEESVPAGWTVTNNGGATLTKGILRWAKIQGAQSTTYTYTVTAPASGIHTWSAASGIHTWSGQYQFEGMSDASQIGGDTQVNVGSGGPSCSDGIQNQDETGVDCGGSVCPACAGSGDIEKLVIVSATDNAQNHETQNPITSAFDGDLTTRWAAEPLPIDITFDFANIQEVSQARLSFYNWDNGRIYQYSISTSIDGSSWTEVLPLSDSALSSQWTIETFNSVNARYVKIHFASNSQSNWAGFWEAEIWGIELSTPPSCIDSDGDGYGQNCPAGPDCNDNDANYHPGATEVCGDPDYNCDGGTMACPTNAVMRSFSSGTVNTGSTLSVTIDIKVPTGTSYYFIEEFVPSGWTITNNGGATKTNNELRWAEIQGAADTTFTYTVSAPSTAGTFTWSGQYQMEGMSIADSIGGSTTVTVQ